MYEDIFQSDSAPKKLSCLFVNNGALYLDGNEIPLDNHNNKEKVNIVSLPTSTRVIAIACKCTDSVCAMACSATDDYVSTDQTWKCATTVDSSWMNLDYDDRNWNNAVLLSDSYQKVHVSDDADFEGKYIWTSSYIDVKKTAVIRRDLHVFCRAVIGKFISQTFNESGMILRHPGV